jgi:hypothetical protein
LLLVGNKFCPPAIQYFRRRLLFVDANSVSSPSALLWTFITNPEPMMFVLKMFGLMAALLALFINFAVAVPTPGMIGPVRQILNQTATLSAADGLFKGRRNGPLEYHRTLSKYNIPIPEGLQIAVDRYAEKLPFGDSTLPPNYI